LRAFRRLNSTEIFQWSVPVNSDLLLAVWVLTLMLLLHNIGIETLLNRLRRRVRRVEFVWGFNFNDFAAEGAFEDTFGGGHNIPSTI
jgi:hypothetical protein